MRSFFLKGAVGLGLLCLMVTSTHCAFYNEATGKEQIVSKAMKKQQAPPPEVRREIPPESVEESYQRGLLAMERGDYTEASDAFLRVFGQDPSYGEIRKKLIQVSRLRQKAQRKEGRVAEVVAYTIGLGDVLNISVWQWPDLAMPDVIVRPDGKISFPLVGDIQAEGLTLTELDHLLTERLKEFIKDPEVSVAISQFGGRKVIVLGEVGSQGVYAPTGKTSVLEVIALAGGFRSTAVPSSVILIRQQPERNLLYRLDLRMVLRQGNMRENIEVESDDIIFVPKRFVTTIGDFLAQINPWFGTILTADAVLKDYDIDVAGRE